MKEYLTTSGEGISIEYDAAEEVDSVIYTILDIELDDVLFAEEAELVGEVFVLELSPEICKYDRKLRIDIEAISYGTASVGSQAGTNGSYTTDNLYVSLVRPYVSSSELAEELGLTIVEENPSGSSEVTAPTLERWERQARMFINSKIDEKIRFQYKNVSVSGEDTDVLYIGERTHSFDKITKDDQVIYDYFDDINLLSYALEISKSKLQLKPIVPEHNIDEGKAMSAIYDPGFFEKGSVYNIRGEFGWSEIPEQIREAIIILVDDMRCNDWSYRNKGLKSVKNDSFAIEFADSAFSGTGNLLVDSLISEFKSWRFFSI